MRRTSKRVTAGDTLAPAGLQIDTRETAAVGSGEGDGGGALAVGR